MDLNPADILPFIETHRAWAPLIFGAMAFGESLAFIGMLIPATVIMMACGTLIGTGTLHLSDLWIGGAIGAALGDSVSYSLGRWLGPRAAMMGPLKRRPHLMTGAERFFARWGWAAVFFGRFIGPMRALVPLAAGILGMPTGWFQVNNILSAIVWIPVVVSPGIFTAWLVHLGQTGHLTLALGLGGVALVLLGAGFWAMRRYGGRLTGER